MSLSKIALYGSLALAGGAIAYMGGMETYQQAYDLLNGDTHKESFSLLEAMTFPISTLGGTALAIVSLGKAIDHTQETIDESTRAQYFSDKSE